MCNFKLGRGHLGTALLVTVAVVSCGRKPAGDPRHAQATPAPAVSQVEQKVRVLIARLERDYASVPECAQVKMQLFNELVQLGPSARPYIEREVERSKIGKDLDFWVLKRIDVPHKSSDPSR